MTDIELRKQLKRIEALVKKLDDEVLVAAIDIIGSELEERSQKYMKWHEDRRRKLK